MGNYKKLGDGHYQVQTEKGSYEIKPSVVGVTVSLSEVSRIASCGNDYAEPAKGFMLSRFINARWEPDEYYFQLISEEGEKRARLPAHVHIAVDDPPKALFSHWTAVGDTEEQFYLQVYVPQETFDWLWDEIQRRPNAIVSVRCKMMPPLAGIEGSMWYDVSYNAIRLEPGGHLEVLSATIDVGDPEPKKEQAPDAELTSKMGQFERALVNATDNTWLKRIFFGVVVIALILLFRR